MPLLRLRPVMTPSRFSFVYARRTRGVLALLAAGTLGTLAAPRTSLSQQIGSVTVPRGRLAFEVAPTFVSWRKRFGLRAEDGGTVEELEPLGLELSDATSTRLFPGVSDLEQIVRNITGDPDFQARLGISRGRVSVDQTRVPIRFAYGVFDWLTVGVTVPLVKSRTELTYSFTGDSANLGVSPLVSDRAGVLAYVGQIETAYLAARDQADLACQEAPASPACADARTLQETAAGYLGEVQGLYIVSNLLPTQGSDAGQQLLDWAANLNGALQSAGLGAPEGALPLPLSPLADTEDVNGMLTADQGGFQTAPLENVVGVWGLGDVEVGAWARLAQGELHDSVGAPAHLRYLLTAGGVVRLGTGAVDDPSIVHDVGNGDGQTDLEGRLYGQVSARRVGISAEISYGVQMSTTLPRRVAPPDVLLPSISSLAEVEWTPGNYLELNVAPSFRLTPELSASGWYALRSKGRDAYRRVTAFPVTAPDLDGRFPGKVYEDVSLLGAESEEKAHSLGLTLLFSTMDAWREGRTGSPFQAFLSVSRAVAGSGGQTPAAFTVRFGVRLYRRILEG